MTDTPQLRAELLTPIDFEALGADPDQKPKILLLYGSLRKTSYSRLMAEEAAHVLEALGAECRFLTPKDCRYRTKIATNIRKSSSYESLSLGAKGWFGLRPNVTVQ